MFFRKIVTITGIFLCLCAFSHAQQIDSNVIASIPDSIRQKLQDEHAVLSIEEAQLLRAALRGDSTILDSPDTLIMPKDSLYDTHVNPLIVSTEVLGLNGIVWAWDYYVLDKDYAHTGPSYWKRNFREGWEWDHNHWAINFYGHPYQGSMYYATARGGG